MSIDSEIDLSFGMKDGELVCIDEVARGLECGCHCPHCGGKLIARKGEVNQHHFAHYKVENCGKGLETALHLLGKQVLQEEQRLRLPHKEELEDITDIEIERRRFGYIADLGAILVSSGEEIDVEIKVTHGVDAAKLEKVFSNNARLVEIDLSDLLSDCQLSRETVKQCVISEAPRLWAEDIQQNQAEDSDMTNKHLVCGYKVASGFSHKTQSNFEFAALNVLVQQEGRSSANYQIHGMGGYEQTTLPMKFDDLLLSKLEKLTFPLHAELVFEMSLIRGKLKPVVSDLRT